MSKASREDAYPSKDCALGISPSAPGRSIRHAGKDRPVRQARLPFGECQDTVTISKAAPCRVVGLFAGIGGVELGLHRAGHRTTLLCEYDRAAMAVLRERFPGVDLVADVRDLGELPETEILAAGFPCQDLSIAGRAAGIGGDRSSLVAHVFRLIDAAELAPRWLVFENVPFILQLHGGRGMRLVVDELEQRGYHWAYRIVDSRAFGLPQRRQRILILASATEDPRAVLLTDDVGEPDVCPTIPPTAYGFYWTEGHRGIGWSPECVPPIKVGSGLGIPSPPAIWFPERGAIVIPDLRDLERLQGFDADWTWPAELAGERNARWRLVGNAVSVPVAHWLGERLCSPRPYDASGDWPVDSGAPWPPAAWGGDGERREASLSPWPIATPHVPLAEFLEFQGRPLSARGAAGLLDRLVKYGTRAPQQFTRDLETLALGGATQATGTVEPIGVI